MQKDEIIRLAREANLPACHASHPVALSRFAALIAKIEREECAKVCEEFYSIEGIAQECAATIRARSNK